MGSLLQHFDLNHGNSLKKFVAHKGKVDGPEAPRNSLEFSGETSHNYNVIQEDIPYSCQVKQPLPKMSSRSNDSPMKRLNINEEATKRMNNECNTPSVVARLMGMDTLPSQTYPAIRANVQKDESNEAIRVGTTHHASSLSSSLIRKAKQDMVPYDVKKEHPQEELLQKFKKDFVAWQKSKAWEHSRTIISDNYLHQAKVNQILAQENLNKEKMARRWESRHYTYKKSTELTSSIQKSNCGTKNKKTFSQTKIVILRPSVEDAKETCSCSPELSEKEVNMQDFLEEVKEKLTSEILGKSTNNPFGAKSKDAKQFAEHIVKELGEDVTRDLKTSLVHSELTRSLRNEFQSNQQELQKRGKNLARTEIQERVKSRTMREFSKLEKKLDHWEDKKPKTNSKVLRCALTDAVFNAEALSPRNLVRSFSAPVSSGVHIHRNQETSEHSSPELKRKKKDGFNLKGKVSNFRQNFTLKGMFFRKKTEFHLVDESAPNESDSLEAVVTAPSLTMKTDGVEDNSTEVPPSPASRSSSSPEEFYRPGVPSPVSPLPAYFIESHSVAEVLTESCTVVPEPRLPSHVEQGEIEVAAIEDALKDEPVEAEGHAQAYIREILTTAGLYEGEVHFGEAFTKRDQLRKLIPNWVFDEVEEAYKRKRKLDEDGYLICNSDPNISRKLLFDLTNETLPRVLRPATSSVFRKEVLCRKNLLDHLWCKIQLYINPRSNESDSIGNMVAQHARADPWCTTLHEDIYVTVKKMEIVILEDLICEFMSELIS